LKVENKIMKITKNMFAAVFALCLIFSIFGCSKKSATVNSNNQDSHDHVYSKATCLSPATCEICGKTDGEKAGHDYSGSSCTSKAKCLTCGELSEENGPHDFTDATCYSKSVCKVCGTIGSGPIDHIYAPATQTSPSECIMCEKTYGNTIEGIKNIMQKPSLPNGCEVVSLAIVLNYLGYDIDPLTLYYNYMPKSPYLAGDPWTTYVGNATGLGLGCFASCVAKTGNHYLGYLGAQNRVYTANNLEMSEYEKYIDQGMPVIFWGLIKMNGNDMYAWQATINGEKVVWYAYSHCLVMIGYTETGYIFCDPLEGVVEYPKEDVEKSFNINFRQACIIE